MELFRQTAPFSEDSAIPTVIYKCNNCEHYTQTKEEMLLHVEGQHANSEQDFISIPTNEAAMQAFQAAVVMATAAAAAAAAAVTNSAPSTPSETPTAVNIKKEPNEEECIEERETVLESACYVNCPLCNDSFLDKTQLEQHLLQMHSVNSDGLERLLLLVDHQMWKNERKTLNEEEKSEKVLNLTKTGQPATPTNNSNILICSQCGATFKHEQQLLQHAQQMEHFTLQANGEYACLAANLPQRPCQLLFSNQAAMCAHYKHEHLGVVISERHVYKYRCKQCSLAFKTPERLATHSLYHMMRDATKCAICQRNFRSTQALQKHVEQAHAGSTANTSTNDLRQQSPTIRLISPDLQSSDQADSKLETEVVAKSISESSEPVECKSIITDFKQQQYSVAKTLKPDLDLVDTKQQMNDVQDALSPMATAPAVSYEMLQRFFMQQQQQQQHLPPHIQNLTPGALLTNPEMPFNPVDMLNMMQFHQLMSLNFMNLAPPLIIGNSSNMLETPNPQLPLDCLSNINCNTPSSSGTKTPLCSNETPAQFLHQTAHVTSNSNQLSNSHKRARTRITDEQLKILRAHFDINNSPSEESIMEMSQKAKLPMKVRTYN